MPYDRVKCLCYLILWRVVIKFDHKNGANEKGLLFLRWHSREFYAVPQKESSQFYVGVPEWWQDYMLCSAFEVLISPVFLCLKTKFVVGRKPRSTTIRGHLNRVACEDHFVMAVVVFSARSTKDTIPYV